MTWRTSPVQHKISHFDIHCDDVPRARRFYETMFQWQFHALPGVEEHMFLQIRTSEGEVIGSIQSRSFNMLQEKLLGYECSIAVADIDAATNVAVAGGAKVLMRRTAIPGVGWISKFQDTEGNLFCAVQYDKASK